MNGPVIKGLGNLVPKLSSNIVDKFVKKKLKLYWEIIPNILVNIKTNIKKINDFCLSSKTISKTLKKINTKSIWNPNSKITNP